jgi:hypothetical protein
MIYLIIGIPLIFYIAISYGQKQVPNNTITAFTGSLGSGKTFMAVKYAIKDYRNKMISYYLKKYIPFLPIPKFTEKPEFYSNIPVRVWFNQWAKMLTYEHLTLATRIQENSTIIIDELGHFASQYQYDHPFVQQYLQEFIRFFRHYVNGRIYLTDQSSSNIVVSIRRRINQIYNLSNFSRYFVFFYRVNVSEIHITEDIMNIQNTTTIDELPYFFGFLPFKFMSIFGLKPRYDTRCYSINYKAPYQDTKHWDNYKTNYFIELPNSNEMRKLYKTNGYLTLEQTQKILTEWQTKDKNNENS